MKKCPTCGEPEGSKSSRVMICSDAFHLSAARKKLGYRSGGFMVYPPLEGEE